LEVLECNTLAYEFPPTIQNIRIFNRFKRAYYRGKYSWRVEKRAIRNRARIYGEELIAAAMHPRRIARILDLDGGLENI
jgi:hypothetical protein